ncbi:fibrosin-1-like protein, partial [Chiloscyllium punctatum]|uniref:fibrosin-1-like protein n=1 Tax=Chiloscyllium punctatum TaxID=137246 RepID=UPI003B63B39B
MEGPGRPGGYRQSRRSRSQRDRDRKLAGPGVREARPYSPSSGSEREAGEGPASGSGPGLGSGPGSSRPRPPRRRRKESTSCEEDIIDGFAIASFPSLEALEKEALPKAPERGDSQRKRLEKRKPEDTRPSSPGEGPRRAGSSDREQNRHNGDRDHQNSPPTKKMKTKGPSRKNESTGGENGSSQRSSSRGAGSDVSAQSSLGTGYFCDIDSDPDDKPLTDEIMCDPCLDLTASAQKHVLHGTWRRISF